VTSKTRPHTGPSHVKLSNIATHTSASDWIQFQQVYLQRCFTPNRPYRAVHRAGRRVWSTGHTSVDAESTLLHTTQ